MTFYSMTDNIYDKSLCALLEIFLSLFDFCIKVSKLKMDLDQTLEKSTKQKILFKISIIHKILSSII